MIEILFENKDFLACIKPVGVPSQCDGAEDAVKLLKEQTGDEIYPVHRLDTAVGGTMIFAKNKKTAAYLSKEIAEKDSLKLILPSPRESPRRRRAGLRICSLRINKRIKAMLSSVSAREYAVQALITGSLTRRTAKRWSALC